MKRLLVVSVVMLLIAACINVRGNLPSFDPKNVVYNRYNIHAQLSPQGQGYLKASDANLTNPGEGHIIIPPNTKLTITKHNKGFNFATEQGQQCFFDVHQVVPVPEYVALITSTTPVSLADLSSLDMKGVNDGKAYRGMTKKGVMTALGYPYKGATTSPDEDVWVYWTNRFKQVKVVFSNGKVTEAP